MQSVIKKLFQTIKLSGSLCVVWSIDIIVKWTINRFRLLWQSTYSKVTCTYVRAEVSSEVTRR
jgi:hypothetical protein